MGYQGDYAMRTINDLARAIARLVLDKSDIDYELPGDKERYTPLGRTYRQLKGLADAGDISEARNFLSDQLDPPGLDCLEVAPTFHMYLSQFNDDTLCQVNYSGEEIVDGISGVCAEYSTSGFEYFVDTTVV